jgi:hypothetical protein
VGLRRQSAELIVDQELDDNEEGQRARNGMRTSAL